MDIRKKFIFVSEFENRFEMNSFCLKFVTRITDRLNYVSNMWVNIKENKRNKSYFETD